MPRWTVRDVMTEQVVSVTEDVPYREIVETLAHHAVSAVPVVGADGRVLGIVSEADLLHKMEFTGLEPHLRLLERKQRRTARAKASGDTARDLMSAPAVTVSPEVALSAAAQAMEQERVKRLPVVDDQGRLVGIVSRRDLLRVYLRDDESVREEIRRQVLHRTLWIDPETVSVSVERGVVTLGGSVDRRSTAQIIVRVCETVPGVVEVVDDIAFDYDDTAELHRHHYLGATVKETVP
ncbi:MAG: CBS domain-containing protein [Micromonosporaceae bacterium]